LGPARTHPRRHRGFGSFVALFLLLLFSFFFRVAVFACLFPYQQNGQIAVLWQKVLRPHVSARALDEFAQLTAFFFNETTITTLLRDPVHRPQLLAIDQALRTLLEAL
jgi:hypothetical protein